VKSTVEVSLGDFRERVVLKVRAGLNGVDVSQRTLAVVRETATRMHNGRGNSGKVQHEESSRGGKYSDGNARWQDQTSTGTDNGRNT